MTERRQHALPLDDWPAADRRAWAGALADDGLLGDSGPAAHLAPSIKDDFTRRYSYFLNFAARLGSLAAGRPPAASVTRGAVEAYIAELTSYASSVTVHRHTYKMMRVVEYIAPERDWSWLRRRTQQLSFLARPRDKRARVVTSDRLVALGFKLMAQAQDHDRYDRDTAVLYRDGVLIAVLALCPLRLGNFASLRLGVSAFRDVTGWSIAIPASESKTSRPYDACLPDLLTEPLDCFLEVYRPRFPKAKDYLWPSARCGGLSGSRIQQIIAARTKEIFGFSLSPHLFRDCAVTTVAIKAGSEMGIAVALLGHRNPRMIDKHYNQAGMIEAARRYQDLLRRFDESNT
jgi:integrase